ncbi:LOW QUALITY PROTEIN: coiled-coil domain-containing protein 112 [Amazona ochrocephala]
MEMSRGVPLSPDKSLNPSLFSLQLCDLGLTPAEISQEEEWKKGVQLLVPEGYNRRPTPTHGRGRAAPRAALSTAALNTAALNTAALVTAVAAVAAGQQQNDSCSSSAGTGRFQNWKMNAQAKKIEFLRTAENLKTQLANLDKDKNVCICNRKSDFRIEYSILEGLEQSLTVSRKTEKAKILQQLSKIKDVKRLQHQLKYMKPTPEFVDKLKEMMEEVENAIHAFKEESIKRWNEKQQQEKHRNLKEKKKSEKMLKEESQQHEEAQKQKAAEERKRQAAMEAWKEQKAIALSMEQASQLKPEEKKEKKQQKERQCQCHMKLVLEKYTLLKKEKEELEKLEKKREEAGKEERKRTAAEEIKFQQSDLQKLELRILQKQAKEEDKREKEKRLANLRR